MDLLIYAAAFLVGVVIGAGLCWLSADGGGREGY